MPVTCQKNLPSCGLHGTGPQTDPGQTLPHGEDLTFIWQKQQTEVNSSHEFNQCSEPKHTWNSKPERISRPTEPLSALIAFAR